jgi:hypothetical protein
MDRRRALRTSPAASPVELGIQVGAKPRGKPRKTADSVNPDQNFSDINDLVAEGAISLSEDPTLRFKFLAEDNDVLNVRVEDTENQVFTRSWNLTAVTAPDS